jgi:hypothetical protein
MSPKKVKKKTIAKPTPETVVTYNARRDTITKEEYEKKFGKKT